MNVSQAIDYVRFILGDNSESVWADTDIIGVLNVSNRRIMARIVEQNPEQYITSYQDFLAFHVGHTGAAPISIPAGSEGISIQGSLEAAWTAEGQANGAFTANPIKLMRLFYSNSAGLDNRIEIPLVPFSALDERTEQNALEYEVLSQTQYGAKYKASYAAGTSLLQVRPIPAKTMYLKIYWAESGVPEIDPDTDTDQQLLMPHIWLTGSSGHYNFANSSKAEAVCFDAAWVLSFKDQSMREAYAAERERILATQSTPMSPSEAY